MMLLAQEPQSQLSGEHQRRVSLGRSQHLPVSTPAEDIADGVVILGFDVISFKQTSATY
jgi:hypothetical protein